MWKAAFAVVWMALFSPAWAQVYKCEGAGATVFSDRPCGTEAQRVEAAPAAGAYDPAAGARRRLETDLLRSRQAADDAARVAARERAQAASEARKASERSRCDTLREQRADAQRWAGEFRHPDNIRREQQKAEAASDRLWWECKQIR